MCREFDDCDVTTLGLNPLNDIVCDLSLSVPAFNRSFEVVVHAAGDARPELADAVNFQGTKNLCKGLEVNPPQEFVFVSSVQVYGKEEGEDYDESTVPAPTTEYGKSKYNAEQFLVEWCEKHSVKLSIIRPPLIIGTRMKGSVRSMVNGIYRGYYFHIGGNEARRSVVHATNVSAVAKKISSVGGVYNVCDGVSPTVHDLAEALAYRMGNKRIYTISMKKAKFFAKIGDLLGSVAPVSTEKLTHLTKTLTFNGDAITKVIDWKPNSVTEYLRTHNYDENSL